MAMPKIRDIRAFLVRGGGADYHDQSDQHWINQQVSTPMSKYPEYRMTRSSFGLNVLGSLVIEIEADDGSVGFGVTTGGEIGAWIVEKHLSRFVIGKSVTDIELIWDQMYNATLFYGRKGIVVNVISGVDLALWDLLGKVRQEPVYQLLGGAVQDELVFYATGARPDLAQKMGFIGGKMPLRHSPAEGEEGLRKNTAELAIMRSRTSDDFWLMVDCWMSLDVEYALHLAEATQASRLKWMEECLPPDDYQGYTELRRRAPKDLLITTGEHEATRWGFQLLLEGNCCDIIQPDVGWCGGLTELLKIAELADSFHVPVIPHGSSVYSYHFAVSRHNSPFSEFLMMSPGADEIIPMFYPLLLHEPLPAEGKLKVPDRPGFGVELNPACKLERPYKR